MRRKWFPKVVNVSCRCCQSLSSMTVKSCSTAHRHTKCHPPFRVSCGVTYNQFFDFLIGCWKLLWRTTTRLSTWDTSFHTLYYPLNSFILTYCQSITTCTLMIPSCLFPYSLEASLKTSRLQTALGFVTDWVTSNVPCLLFTPDLTTAILLQFHVLLSSKS